MLGRLGQMLAVPCGCVKHFWGKDVKNAHTRMPEGNHTHTHTDRGREGTAGMAQPSWVFHMAACRAVSRLGGCFTLGTVPDVKLHGKAFP